MSQTISSYVHARTRARARTHTQIYIIIKISQNETETEIDNKIPCIFLGKGTESSTKDLHSIIHSFIPSATEI